ncbi:hypothetical protein [Sandaracinus amylolyticus]|uniref:Uncharacterized protein n=1 Tax=Sandaracinus amylolyticus TaxID=927083 RepID=A0A0F6SE37_9BACT|nr:hypothetical protein [Sandaracinus amylolyticus]AKF04514.1 hypothetical protein DB32_001663 [Sandaracinus amylolyticus]
MAARFVYYFGPAKPGIEADMSKLSDFLSTNKIDSRRVVLASKDIEQRTAEDRKLVATKKAMKDGKAEKDEAVLKQKPRSGRPVTGAAMTKALGGQTVSGPVKTRIVKAVNAVLTQKKKPEITLRDLF